MLCVNITEDYFSEEFCEMFRDTRKQRALLLFIALSFSNGGAAVEQWLRCYATNRKVAGSIPDGVLGIFH